jgi:hypothetical protein
MNDKKVKIYEVDYYPYGDDKDSDSGGGWGSNRRINTNTNDKELESFISALFGGNMNNNDDYDE